MYSTAARRARAAGAAAAGAAFIMLAAAACGDMASPVKAARGASHSGHAMASHHPMAAAVTFGAQCHMIPATGMGSLHAMGMDPVVTAAADNPLLTKFAAQVRAAGLVTRLNSMRAITIFAPSNAAFAALTGSAMSMMHGTTELAKVLEYHVVSGRVSPAELAAGTSLTTLEGSTIKVAKMGSAYEVNDADVVCGNIQAANATIYIISKVLIPMH